MCLFRTLYNCSFFLFLFFSCWCSQCFVFLFVNFDFSIWKSLNIMIISYVLKSIVCLSFAKFSELLVFTSIILVDINVGYLACTIFLNIVRLMNFWLSSSVRIPKTCETKCNIKHCINQLLLVYNVIKALKFGTVIFLLPFHRKVRDYYSIKK